MADLETTLLTVLTTGTVSVSAGVWAVRKPMDEDLPIVVFRRITSLVHQHHGSTGVAGLPKKERFQITCMETTYEKLIPLQKLVDACLVGNVTNFMTVQPVGEAIEDRDEPSKVYTSMRDYYVWSKV